MKSSYNPSWYIDATEIIQRCVYEELFIRFLGNPVKEDDEFVYYPCPFCDLTEDSFKVSKIRNHFVCSFCGIGGNSINFVKEMELVNSESYRTLLLWMKLLLNIPEEGMDERSVNSFYLKSLKFNFALMLDHVFLQEKNQPVFLSKEDIEKLEEKLVEIGFSKRKIKKINLRRMEERYVLCITEGLYISDFIAYNPQDGICYSVLYNTHNLRQMEKFKQQIKSQIN